LSEAKVELTYEGDRVVLSGPLTFDTVSSLSREVNLFQNSGSSVTVDFAGVSRADSAALALLLDWMRQASAKGRRVEFSNLPENMLALAKVSGIDELLPLRSSN